MSSAVTSTRLPSTQVGMNVHGDAHTHLDALCHVAYDGLLYGGVPAGTLTSAGAGALTVDLASAGLVGRGVLLDIAGARGTPWLEPGDHVTTEDLQRAETAQGVRVGPGDILCVRVGHHRRRSQTGAWDVANGPAGLHPTAMRFLAERQVAVLGSDGNNDTAPSAVPEVPYPVHVLAVNAMGLQLGGLPAPRGARRAVPGAAPLVLLLRDRPAAPGKRHRLAREPHRRVLTAQLRGRHLRRAVARQFVLTHLPRAARHRPRRDLGVRRPLLLRHLHEPHGT